MGSSAHADLRRKPSSPRRYARDPRVERRDGARGDYAWLATSHVACPGSSLELARAVRVRLTFALLAVRSRPLAVCEGLLAFRGARTRARVGLRVTSRGPSRPRLVRGRPPRIATDRRLRWIPLLIARRRRPSWFRQGRLAGDGALRALGPPGRSGTDARASGALAESFEAPSTVDLEKRGPGMLAHVQAWRARRAGAADDEGAVGYTEVHLVRPLRPDPREHSGRRGLLELDASRMTSESLQHRVRRESVADAGSDRGRAEGPGGGRGHAGA